MSEQNKRIFITNAYENMEQHRDALKRSFFENAENYFFIYAITNKLLQDYYAFRKIEGELILDIEKFAEALGFEIKREPLNKGRKQILGRILGRLEVMPDIETQAIYVEQDIITEQQERYAIAYLLGYYFMQKNAAKILLVECAELRIPQTPGEFNARIFATFLLLQPDKIFEVVTEYVKSMERPINQEALLLEMSKWVRVPYHFVITGYEYLKVVAGLYHNKAFRERLKDRLEESSEELKQLEQIWEKEKLVPDEFFY